MKLSNSLPALLLLLIFVFGAFAFHWRASIVAAVAESGTAVQTAATFFVESITTQALRLAYQSSASSMASGYGAAPKLRILIVPGHEPNYGGAEYADYTERDIVVDIAEKLAAMMAANPRYEVIVARSKTAWHPTLEAYFNANTVSIEVFRGQQMALMKQHLQDGTISGPGDLQVYHNDAPQITAFHLYGINKWASENKVGITLHLHVNDYAGRRGNTAGEYTGFSIYIPDRQYSNAKASRDLAEALAGRLNAFHATSSLPQESSGIIEDLELIAIGSNNSADAASILVEYGYIYEKQFSTHALRDFSAKDYAKATYLGLQDFFHDPLLARFGTAALPYTWTRTLEQGDIHPDVYALQTALRVVNAYPPPDKNFNDCPISGLFGPCTIDSVRRFQTAHSLKQTGIFDQQTQEVLTNAYLAHP